MKVRQIGQIGMLKVLVNRDHFSDRAPVSLVASAMGNNSRLVSKQPLTPRLDDEEASLIESGRQKTLGPKLPFKYFMVNDMKLSSCAVHV